MPSAPPHCLQQYKGVVGLPMATNLPFGDLAMLYALNLGCVNASKTASELGGTAVELKLVQLGTPNLE